MYQNSCIILSLLVVFLAINSIESSQLSIDDNLASLHSYSWFIHFIKNLIDYFVVIIPISLLIYLVKEDILPSYVKQIRWVKFLVYGVPNNNELPLTIIDGEPLLSSSTSVDQTEKSNKRNDKYRNIFHLFYCFIGLQISFLTWGILQEKIMTQNYRVPINFIESNSMRITDNLLSIVSTDFKDPKIIDIKFRNAQFLVLINRILAFIFATAILFYKDRHRKSNHQSFFNTKQPPFYMYIYCSLSNIMSSWCQYEALKYVSFPAQVLSKGCKMIPTMLMNRILLGRIQKREEWVFAIILSFGMTLFMLNEHEESKLHHETITVNDSPFSSFISGIIILILYLTFDAFTSNWQQSLFDQYRSLTSLHMMAAVNFYSILFTLTSLLQHHDFYLSLNLLFIDSSLMFDCLILSICSAVGQLFIFHTISIYGAIIFTLMMTLRQAFAILLSCIIYSHTISFLGIIGIVIIFASLFLKTYRKFSEKKSKTSMNKRINQNV